MKAKANVTCQVSISDVNRCYSLAQFLAVNSFCILSSFAVFCVFLTVVTPYSLHSVR